MDHYHLFPDVSPQESADYLAKKLAFYTDAADLAEDLRQQNPQIVVLDVRRTTETYHQYQEIY